MSINDTNKNDNLVISNTFVTNMERKDPLFATKVQNTLKTIKSLIKKTPNYASLVLEKMNDGDVYRAIIPSNIRKSMENGSLEKMLRTDSKLFTGMIRNSSGKKEIIKQVEWGKVEYSSDSLSNLSNISLQASIAEVSEMILKLDKKMDRVLTFQHTEYISRVLAGIHQYEQAQKAFKKRYQSSLVINALQSLNEGRASLMEHLKGLVSKEPRDSKFSDYLWKLALVDKREVDLRNEIYPEYEKIKQDIKYINLSTAYIFRCHVAQNELKCAEVSKIEYLDFCNTVSDKISNISDYFPLENTEKMNVNNIIDSFLTAKLEANNSFSNDRDLVIEFSKGELSNE